jgi:hypothetical protein
MKNLQFIILLIFFSLPVYAQKLSCKVFVPVINNDKLLVDTIYISGRDYFIHTKKGETQPAVIQKKVYCDTVYLKVKNFPYMINLKYHSTNFLKLEVLLFHNKGANSIILKQISNKKVSSYRFRFLKNINVFTMK